MTESSYWLIKLLAENGFSYKCICKRVGCSKSEVYKVLHKADIKLRDYRDGTNDVAKTRFAILKRKTG